MAGVRPWRPLKLLVFIEVFCGTGRLGRAVAREGWPTLLWDVTLGPSYDLRRRHNRSLLHGWIKAGLVRGFHCGFPCSSFSRARDVPPGPPPLRSNLFPMGLPDLARPGDKEAVAIGNLLMVFTVALCTTGIRFKAPWTIENPRRSRAWLCPAMLKLLARRGVRTQDVEFCRFGLPWRKSTRFGAYLVDLSRLDDFRCTGKVCARTGQKHTVLCGRDAAGNWLTKVAEPYPEQLCSIVARAFVNERARARADALSARLG